MTAERCFTALFDEKGGGVGVGSADASTQNWWAADPRALVPRDFSSSVPIESDERTVESGRPASICAPTNEGEGGTAAAKSVTEVAFKEQVR